MNAAIRSTLAALIVLASLPASAETRHYRFTKVADDLRDKFNLNSFTCASINKRGEVAFKASRTSADGFNFFDGIYRRNSNGSLTTIVEDPDRTSISFVGNTLSLNEKGEVAFGAGLASADFTNAILRGDGGHLVTIASTAGQLGSVGFDVSINKHGEVAFVGGLDPDQGGAQGLFSGSGGAVTTHYLTSRDARLDGRPARFFGSFDRPSIDKEGSITFHEFLQPDFAAGIFRGRTGVFHSVAAGAPFERQFGVPVVNEKGDAVFQTSFFDADGTFVTAIVKSDDGRMTTIVDTKGAFGFFGFRPAAINEKGEVAFLAFLADFSNSGIFTGPDPVADKVIACGDPLDGATVSSFGLQFCEEGVNDDGVVVFIAQLDDPNAPFGVRSVIFRATPAR